MVKSSASCFKIITCGSDSVDHDDLQASESKGSSGRGWSFRKKSSRHRVLSNTVNSEAPSSANKGSPESTAVNVQTLPNLSVPEKTSVITWTEEKTELSAQPEPNVSDIMASREDDCRSDATLDESSIIFIQAAIRGLLAQKVLLKQKNIIKLQAVVRGHLVRRHAVGTLRCVQAIVKMQALVRARRARILAEGSGDFEKQSEISGKYECDQAQLSKREAKPHGTYTYISIEKLLSNRFACQLMNSTPRTQPINIKCEPLKSDSAWKWLERWMSVSSVTIEEPQESKSVAELLHEKENLGDSEAKKEILVPSDCYSDSADLKPGVGALAESDDSSENDDNLITYDADNLDVHSSKSSTPSPIHPKLQNIDESDSTYDTQESAPTETRETILISDLESKCLPDKGETQGDYVLPGLEKLSIEQPETEAKKLSKKASNPSFIAAQSKFEELTSGGTSVKSATSSCHDLKTESSLDKVSSSTDQPFKSKEIESADNFISNTSSIQIGDSECGTELSVTSTLDSPDRSVNEVNYLQPEPKVIDVIDHPRSTENLGLEANGNQLEKHESFNSVTVESVSSILAEDSTQLEKKPEANPNELPLEPESEANNLVNMPSPGASPRSHITVPESEATPSSQVSVKRKKNRGDKRSSDRKAKSSSADKKIPSNPNQDSASKSSSDQKDNKTGKRRNSFGSTKPETVDQEPRDSSSSISIPSYMQATQSARAKAIANDSPRSSPDVNDKDIFIKKRHSLPGTNGRHGSPRIQRSLSQAQQDAKGNGTNSPQGII
ncbi:hypothetical protein ACJIZ3_024833 [Penstemon smallii]|uniref:DUF4005 domain-containing protein n=1 Tax=Penstemon smallii TaxID=265156 RepID=A0ABD3TSZ3_9LAMI